MPEPVENFPNVTAMPDVSPDGLTWTIRIKPGIYEFRAGESWKVIVDKLVRGDVVKARIVVPEGWTSAQIAARIAAQLGGSADSIQAQQVTVKFSGAWIDPAENILIVTNHVENVLVKQWR